MSVAEKFVGGLVLIGILTTILLPGRQTVPTINAGSKLVNGAFGTVISGSSKGQQ